MFAFPVGRIYTNVRLSLYLKSTSTITGVSQTLMDTLVSRAELKTLISGDVDMDTPVSLLPLRACKSQRTLS